MKIKPNEKFHSTIEATSINLNENFIVIEKDISPANNFLLMLQLAFNSHKAIAISPDNIWLLICQGIAACVKEDKTILNESFFEKVEKTSIVVTRNDFKIGESNPWEEIFPKFTAEINKLIGIELYEKFVLTFTTSTQKDISGFEIAFMDTMANYFHYEFHTLCGIPEIKLLGKKEDYQKIQNSLTAFKDLNLSWWINEVEIVITEFISAFDGVINLAFWNSIFKEDNESGGPFITGWITKFFPILKMELVEENGKILSTELDVLRIENTTKIKKSKLKILSAIVKNPCLKKEAGDQSKLNLDNFNNGLNTVSFVWNYHFEELKMNFLSGFIGITENDSCLSTETNWIIRKG
jgi:Domain of unknown function (DUF4419)